MRPDPVGSADAIASRWFLRPVRLVLDTNVYLDVRDAVGVDDEGALLPLAHRDLEHPAVAVALSLTLLGAPVSVLVDDVVRGELYDKLRHGYGAWAGTASAAHAARLLVNTVGVVEAPVIKVNAVAPADLPDPPLPVSEKHDRCLWAQAVENDALLVTSDRKLLEAIWVATGDITVALRPQELIAVARRLA